MKTLFGGIEAGGTKFVCAVGSGPDDLYDEIRFPTTTPTETIGTALEYFQKQHEKQPLAAIGIGSFGPVDLREDSPTFGYITSTPKPGWAHTDVAGVLKSELKLEIAFDTDVNAAALGECRWGAGQGLNNLVYLTIGTGIGGGVMVNGELLHGLVHPEMGHVAIKRAPDDADFTGNCPYHGDCFEGLAAGPALRKRWGRPAQELPEEHPAWGLQAYYTAVALCSYIYTLSPQRIILGGGVMEQLHLFPRIRREVVRLLNNYVAAPEVGEGIDRYIVPPGLGNRAGILGAIALAQQAAGD